MKVSGFGVVVVVFVFLGVKKGGGQVDYFFWGGDGFEKKGCLFGLR